MFLNNNRRIEALISVIRLALLIFSLVERAVRLALSPAVKLAGRWPDQPAKPTGRLIFTAEHGPSDNAFSCAEGTASASLRVQAGVGEGVDCQAANCHRPSLLTHTLVNRPRTVRSAPPTETSSSIDPVTTAASP